MKNTIYCVMGAILVTLTLVFFINIAMTGETMPADQYTKVLLENDQMRVIEINRPPGTITPMHTHPPYVVYFFNSFEMKNTFADGTVKVVKSKAGVAKWKSKGATHAHEVLGTENVHLLLVEMKQ